VLNAIFGCSGLALTRALTSVGEKPLVAQPWYIWSNKFSWYP
jgi:hypothetical protein